MDFFIIALPALLIMIIMKYKYSHDITTKECVYHFLAVCLSIAIMMGVTYASVYASMADTEILNGKVLNKTREVEICTQSSSCKNYTLHEKCSYYTDSKGKRHESCKSYKVFDYPYEVNWYVKTSVDSHEIKRVNAQGTRVPPRWEIIKIGDPASTTHTYINYLLGNKESLFHEEEYQRGYTEEYKKSLPEYPKVYDYYRVNHVLNLTGHNVSGYNDYLNLVLRDMGKEKQVNILLVLYPVKDSELPKAILGKWRGGKKNDVIMFVALDETGTVRNFTSTSFAQGSNNEMLHSKLRMDAMSEKMSLDLVRILVKDINQDFKRLPNEEFEYLKYKLEPSLWVVILCSILAAVSSLFVGNYMRKVDL